MHAYQFTIELKVCRLHSVYLHLLYNNYQKLTRGYNFLIIIWGCAVAAPGGPWCPTFALGRVENLSFFHTNHMLGTYGFRH